MYPQLSLIPKIVRLIFKKIYDKLIFSKLDQIYEKVYDKRKKNLLAERLSE